MSAARPKVYLSVEDYEMIGRAAYWEGYKSRKEFVSAVMRRYIDQRQAERGSHYGPPRWRGGENDEDAVDPE